VIVTEPDYGEAINLVATDGTLRADMSGPMVTRVRALLMRVLARLFTPPGALFYAFDVGENVYDLINTTESDDEFSSKASAYAAEAEREQGVLSARCLVRRDTVDRRKVRVSLTLDIAGRTVGLNLIVSPGEAARVLFSGV
jgi:hypothetical protein